MESQYRSSSRSWPSAIMACISFTDAACTFLSITLPFCMSAAVSEVSWSASCVRRCSFALIAAIREYPRA